MPKTNLSDLEIINFLSISVTSAARSDVVGQRMTNARIRHVRLDIFYIKINALIKTNVLSVPFITSMSTTVTCVMPPRNVKVV